MENVVHCWSQCGRFCGSLQITTFDLQKSAFHTKKNNSGRFVSGSYSRSWSLQNVPTVYYDKNKSKWNLVPVTLTQPKRLDIFFYTSACWLIYRVQTKDSEHAYLYINQLTGVKRDIRVEITMEWAHFYISYFINVCIYKSISFKYAHTDWMLSWTPCWLWTINTFWFVNRNTVLAIEPTFIISMLMTQQIRNVLR